MAYFLKHTALLGDIPTAVKMAWKKSTCGWKEKLWCVSVFTECACVEVCIRTRSVHFFGSVFGVFVGGDVSESDVLLLRALLVAYFPLHVEADHQLVDHHTDDGAEERGENGHQEPAFSSPEE